MSKLGYKFMLWGGVFLLLNAILKSPALAGQAIGATMIVIGCLMEIKDNP